MQSWQKPPKPLADHFTDRLCPGIEIQFITNNGAQLLVGINLLIFNDGLRI